MSDAANIDAKTESETSTSTSSLASSSSSSPSSSDLAIANSNEDSEKTASQTTRTTITSRAVASSSSSTTLATSSSNSNSEDTFENLQKAVTILAKAKQLDELKQYDEALKMYRQGVDMLLEELIVRQGTDQSRTYLRDKCNDFMNRIDQVKSLFFFYLLLFSQGMKSFDLN